MTEHYFTKNPKSEFVKNTIECTILGNKLTIISGTGLFSKEKIDKGSLLLINNVKIKDNNTVLDFGCGYGVIGISIAKRYKLKKIVFSDINKRAVALTEKNCKKNNIISYEVIQSDVFENIKEKYDTILLNPPQTVGKDLCIRMIEESFDHLNPEGNLQIFNFKKSHMKIFDNTFTKTL